MHVCVNVYRYIGRWVGRKVKLLVGWKIGRSVGREGPGGMEEGRDKEGGGKGGR